MRFCRLQSCPHASKRPHRTQVECIEVMDRLYTICEGSRLDGSFVRAVHAGCKKIQHLLRERKKEHSTSTRRCTCGRSGGTCSCQSNHIEEKRCHDDPIAPNSSIWDWYVKEHCQDVDPGVLIDVRTALTGTWSNPKFQFCRATLSWMPRSDRLNSPNIYSKYLLWESSSCFYSSDSSGWAMPILFWAGGTYARRPEDFRKSNLLPLGWRSSCCLLG